MFFSAQIADDAVRERLCRYCFQELPELVVPRYWAKLRAALPFDPTWKDLDPPPPWDPQTPTGQPYATITLNRPGAGPRTAMYSEAKIADAIKKAEQLIILSLGELDADGVPISNADLRLTWQCPDGEPGLVTFYMRRDDTREDHATFSDAVLDTCTQQLYDLCQREDLDFASVGDRFVESNTRLEWALHRKAADGMREARKWLRGYSWITVVPRELAERLGGARAMTESGAFWQVEALPSGGLWLRATERIDEYGPENVRRIFTALAPVLPPGQPQTTWRGTRDRQSWRTIQEDAADHR